MKVSILYEVVNDVNIDKTEEVNKNLDFQAMWDNINEIDPEANCEGEILQVVDVNTKEEYYC